MKQLNPQHQTPSTKDLLHTLQVKKPYMDNCSGPKTNKAEDDLVFSEEEEEKPHNDQLVVLPTKSWGPLSIKPQVPEPVLPATQHPEEDQTEGVDDVQEERISYCPPSFTWRPVFFLQPLRFSTFEVGPKALTGAGLMVYGLHCEAGPRCKKTPKNKALGTSERSPKPKGPPPTGQLLEMFEKNLRRISTLCDFICQKPTLSILGQKSPRSTRDNTQQTVRKKSMEAKGSLFSKHEIWTNGPMVKPLFQSQNLHPKATLNIQTPFRKPLSRTQGPGPLSTMHATQPLGGAKWPLAPKRGDEKATQVHEWEGHHLVH